MLARKATPWLISLLLLLGFQILALRGLVSRSFPGLQKSLPNSCQQAGQELTPSCACTIENVPVVGFPFRTNVYDSCHQDGTNVWWVMIINFSIQLLSVILVFLGINKLLDVRRNS